MYETFDHTADLGLRARAADLPELFVEMARGLLSIQAANPSAVRAVLEHAVELASDRLDDLLFDWLNELLYPFEANRLLFSRFEVEVRDGRLIARAAGEHYDPERHLLEHEVKAITYHGLKCEPCESGWLAEAIFDI
jgi:SHS2 domain-containing protein